MYGNAFQYTFLIIKHNVQCVKEIHKVEKVLFFSFRPTMQIFVKISSDEKISLEVNPSDTIQDVKFKIEDQLSIPPDLHRLTLEGKQLEEKRQLFHYSIQKESVLQLIYQNGNALSYLVVSVARYLSHS